MAHARFFGSVVEDDDLNKLYDDFLNDIDNFPARSAVELSEKVYEVLECLDKDSLDAARFAGYEIRVSSPVFDLSSNAFLERLHSLVSRHLFPYSIQDVFNSDLLPSSLRQTFISHRRLHAVYNYDLQFQPVVLNGSDAFTAYNLDVTNETEQYDPLVDGAQVFVVDEENLSRYRR